MGQVEKVIFFSLSLALLSTGVLSSVPIEERCHDDSFCKAYCLSTNPDTVSARCGRDLASCICNTPSNQAVKVRFIEERNPVPPTQPTTPRSTYQYVNSQPLPSHGNGIGNGNGLGYQPLPQQQPEKPNPMTPILLECDASERATRLCHNFCTVEIRAWYGLCNITSKACACFGIPLSAVQQEPIAAIFHSTAPVTPAPPTTTPRPTYPPARPSGQQQYPLYQYPPGPQQAPSSPKPNSQHWRPVPPSYQPLYNYYQYPNAPHPPQELAPQAPVRSAAGLIGPNGQPLPSSFSTSPDTSTEVSMASSHSSSGSQPAPVSLESDVLKPVEEPKKEEEKPETTTTTTAPSSSRRRRRSINNTPVLKGKEAARNKEMVTKDGECSRYKCAISCKRNNYLAPDCEPKCIDGECWCECFPRL